MKQAQNMTSPYMLPQPPPNLESQRPSFNMSELKLEKNNYSTITNSEVHNDNNIKDQIYDTDTNKDPIYDNEIDIETQESYNELFSPTAQTIKVCKICTVY